MMPPVIFEVIPSWSGEDVTAAAVRALDDDALDTALAGRVASLTCARAGADPPGRAELVS
jgi:hypothetical protein